MADYKELLRRAISALPENNGAARRAVYEKARSALVGQLRAIQPPLPAREITQHRLQLEDCIRLVEQEASEAIISFGREAGLGGRPASPASQPVEAMPAPAAPMPADVAVAEKTIEPKPEPPPEPKSEPKFAPKPEPKAEPRPDAMLAGKPEAKPEPVLEPKAPPALAPAPASTASIEDIIAQAAASSGAEIGLADKDAAIRAPQADLPPPAARREPAPAAPARVEPSIGVLTAATAQTGPAPVVETALSSEREVEVDEGAREAEGVISRAIETLDREARGEATETLPDRDNAETSNGNETVDDAGFAIAGQQQRSGAGLTIFLVVFALLLVGVGGAGFWAWREGFINLDQMFGRAQTEVAQTPTTTEQITVPTMDATPDSSVEGVGGPGNTATTTTTEPTSALEGLEAEDRLEPTPEPVTPSGNEPVLPSIENGEVKSEERLSGADTTIAATDDPAASVDPAVLAGNQSLLLEASSDGRSGAVPFSGTVEWTQGTDEIGMPTLIAEASIPARNLGVSVTIRKNADPSLPASHLMEVSFDVPDTFIGGSIASLAGVLLKNEELVPGTALAGASARVVGNSFLFALSATPADATANADLLTERRWMDLAIVYGTGRNAILTLEKDEDAQGLFDQVFAEWDN